MQRDTLAADGSVQGTLERPPGGSGSAVAIGNGYPSEFGALGYGGPRSGGYPGLYGSTAPAPDGVKVLDPASLLVALKRRWVLALSLGLLTGVIAAAAVWNLWPPITGGAQIQLMINAVGPYIFFQEPTGDFNVFKRTQAMVITSRPIIDIAIRNPQVAGLPLLKSMRDPIRDIQQNLAPDFAKDELMTLSFPATPENIPDAKILLNAIVDTYLDERTKNSPRSQRLKVLQEMYKPIEDKIRQQRHTLNAIVQALSVKDAKLVERRLQFQLKNLDAIESEFLKLKTKRAQDENELEYSREKLKHIADQPITEQELAAVMMQNDAYRNLHERIALEEEELVKKGATASLKAREKIQKLLSTDKIKLQKMEFELRKVAEDVIRQHRVGDLQKRIAELESMVSFAMHYETKLGKAVEKLRDETHLSNQTNEEAEVIKEQIKEQLILATNLVREIDQVKIELKAPDRVRKMGDIYDYEPTISRKQMMSTWAAGFGSFGLVLFSISWWEFRGRRINSVDEVVNNLGLRVVGALPALPDRRNGRGMPANDSFYPNYLIESVDTTRTMLLHAARREALRSVMVTSANSGEGKTSLSIQLAASLARAGRKTLLIDGDMRNPAVHQVFNLSREPGFSELVRAEVEIAATVVPTSVRNLWLIPGGHWNPHTTEVLSQEAVVPILERLKTEFDFIIIDSSPVLAAVDSLLIGQQVDAVIFSILHEVSHSPSVYAAHQRLESLGIRILGAVVNGVHSTQLGHKTEYVYEDESPPLDEENAEED